jgi:hypothetical protein
MGHKSYSPIYFHKVDSKEFEKNYNKIFGKKDMPKKKVTSKNKTKPKLKSKSVTKVKPKNKVKNTKKVVKKVVKKVKKLVVVDHGIPSVPQLSGYLTSDPAPVDTGTVPTPQAPGVTSKALETEMKIAAEVKAKQPNTTVPFHKQDEKGQFKTLFNIFPVDETGGVTGRDPGYANAELPKLEEDKLEGDK